MSIESEILRIQRNVANAYAAVSEKGGEVPLQPTSANLEAAVRSIQTGVTQEQLDEAMAVKQDKLTGHPGQVVGFNTSGTAQTVQGWSNPNLLDNWYFADPINQRGQAEYVAATASLVYTIDRWRLGSGTIAVADGYIKFLSSKVAEYKRLWESTQYCAEAGRTYTLSMLARVNDVSGTVLFRPVTSQGGTVPNFESTISDVTDTFKLFMYTFVPRNNVENIGVEVLCMDAPNSYIDIDIAAWKLELGAQQTLAHQDINGNWVLNDPPPNKALELAKCQRYYLSSYINNPPGTPQTFENELVLIAIKNDRFNVNGIEFPARMRITPNVTFYAPGSGNPGYATESGSSNEVRIASVIAGPDRVNIGAPDNNLVVGHEYYLHYVADARL